jgi:mannose-6-phosphate isomerase-like protein (cupin superfamily)
MVDWTTMLEGARAVVAGSGAPESARFLAAWPPREAPRAVAPTALPVLAWLETAARAAPPGALGTLARRVADAAPALAWRQSYRPGDVPAAFLERYGYSELLGAAGPVPCAVLAGGVLLLGPQTRYPAHRHVAEELYIPLAGAAEWQRGDAPFAVRAPGEAVFHASGESHAMRTGAAPLLALYLWRGSGLGESAWLDDAPSVQRRL